VLKASLLTPICFLSSIVHKSLEQDMSREFDLLGTSWLDILNMSVRLLLNFLFLVFDFSVLEFFK
jgi:hypothetical protein